MAQGIIFGQATGGGSPIKNIQHGVVTMGNDVSYTATIDSVTTADTLLLMTGWTANGDSGSDWDNILPTIELTNSTTITGKQESYGNDGFIAFCVIEFNSGVLKSNQSGTIVATGVSNTDTIDSVDTTKSIISYLGNYSGYANSTTDVCDDVLAYVELTDATTVTAIRKASNDTITLNYQVVEFN